MLLKMKTTLAGPEYAVQADQLWECPDDKLARQLIDGGNAEEVEPVAVEMTSPFHGGLRASNRPIDELTGEVAPNPTMSTAREAAQVDYPYDRRTADEIAADARLSATGGVQSTGPLPTKSSDQRATEEVNAKVAQAKAAVVDPKASTHESVVAEAKKS
jgi:hypothetical protein